MLSCGIMTCSGCLQQVGLVVAVSAHFTKPTDTLLHCCRVVYSSTQDLSVFSWSVGALRVEGRLLTHMQADLSRAVGTKDIPAEVTTAVRNNGGGHWNHSFFWAVLAKPDTKQSDYQAVASDQLKKAIVDQWGSLNAFQAKFDEAATAVFGSGCESTACMQSKCLHVYTSHSLSHTSHHNSSHCKSCPFV